jgi:hypothetical protein
MRNQIGSGHSSPAPHCSSASAQGPNYLNSSQIELSALFFNQNLRQSPQKCVSSRPRASTFLETLDWYNSRRSAVQSAVLTSLLSSYFAR